MATGYNYDDYKIIIGTSKKDYIYNSGRYCDIDARGGNDTVYNYNGDYASINGGAGNDAVRITGSYYSNTVDGGAGNDNIMAYGGSLQGGAGNDMLNSYYSSVYATATMNGGNGKDTLWGGYGDDIMTGGSGKDLFIYANGDGNDIITDYKSGDDKIIIRSSSSIYYGYSGKDVVFTTGSGSLTVKNGKGKKITVNGTTKKYSNVSSSVSLLFAENNFATADDLSAIVKNDLAPISEVTTQNFNELDQKNNLITYTDK